MKSLYESNDSLLPKIGETVTIYNFDPMDRTPSADILDIGKVVKISTYKKELTILKKQSWWTDDAIEDNWYEDNDVVLFLNNSNNPYILNDTTWWTELKTEHKITKINLNNL